MTPIQKAEVIAFKLEVDDRVLIVIDDILKRSWDNDAAVVEYWEIRAALCTMLNKDSWDIPGYDREDIIKVYTAAGWKVSVDNDKFTFSI